MDQAKAELLRLCDEALREVESTLSEFVAAGEDQVWIDLLNRLTRSLVRTRQQAIDDVLPRQGGGTLGLSYAVSESGLTEKGPSGLKVYDACWNLDKFFAEKYR